MLMLFVGAVAARFKGIALSFEGGGVGFGGAGGRFGCMCSFVDSPAVAFGGLAHDEWSQSFNLTLDEKRKFKEKGGKNKKPRRSLQGIH